MSGAIELKINGILIGNIYYHNEGYVSEAECNYTYEYHSWPNGWAIKGELIHTRVQGVETLAELIFRDINHKRLKELTGK